MVNSAKKIQRLREDQDLKALEDIEMSEDSVESEDEDEDEEEEEDVTAGIGEMSLDSFGSLLIQLAKGDSNPLESGDIPDYINSDIDPHRSIDHLPIKLDPLRAKDTQSKSLNTSKLSYAHLFGKWKESLLQGFNILIYGPGSKIDVLGKFYKYLGEDNPPRINVNAFHPLITIRKILEKIWHIFDRYPPTSANIDLMVTQTLDLLTEIASNHPLHLFIVLNNLEGPNFILTETQDVLSRIASHPSVHLIASLDNPYLLYRWSIDTNIRFNFLYTPVPTFFPYIEELAVAEKLPIFNKSMTFAQLRGTKCVLQSMTNIQRQILLQLANIHKTHARGMAFVEFFKVCEEETLVTNQKQLKDFLIEARDHQMIAYKTGQNGENIIQLKTDAIKLIELINEIA